MKKEVKAPGSNSTDATQSQCPLGQVSWPLRARFPTCKQQGCTESVLAKIACAPEPVRLAGPHAHMNQDTRLLKAPR